GASGRRTVRRRGPPNVQAGQNRRRRPALDGGAREGPVRARAGRPSPRGHAGGWQRRDQRGHPGWTAARARPIPLAPSRRPAPTFLGGHKRHHRRLAGRRAPRAARRVDQAGARARLENDRRLVFPTHAPARRGTPHRHGGRTPRPIGTRREGAAPARARRAATRARDTRPVRPPTHAAPRTPTISAPSERARARSGPERPPASAANNPAACAAATQAATAAGDSTANKGTRLVAVSSSTPAAPVCAATATTRAGGRLAALRQSA